jgi:hypothetical protein
LLPLGKERLLELINEAWEINCQGSILSEPTEVTL